MIKIFRKSFTPKKLAFLVSFALLSHGFCVNSFAGVTDGAGADAETAIYSSVPEDQNAGNASTEDSSSQVGEKVASIALSENTDLLIADKSDGKISDADSDTSLDDSIPGSDDAFEFQNNVGRTSDDATSIFETESSITLLDAATSDQAIDTDELASGSSAAVSESNTAEDDTETTTEEGKAARRGASGNGRSSGKASKGASANNNNDASSDKGDTADTEKTGNEYPDRKGTDTPDTQDNRSNNDGRSQNGEGTDPNGNGSNSSTDPNGNGSQGGAGLQNGNNGLDGTAGSGADLANAGKASVGADKGANGAHSVGTLPQTGSAADTTTITLCGLALIALGSLLAKKKQKS